MKSVQIIKFGEPLREVNSEIPKPKGTEVLLRVHAAGVCHTDLHLWHGGYDLGNGKTMQLEERGVKLPLTMGHENVGEIVATGSAVNNLDKNDLQLVYPWLGCGVCDICLEGRENYCSKPDTIGINRPGGYAEYLLVPHPRYLIPLKGIDPIAAAPLACSGLSCFSALKKFDPKILKDKPLVVIGAGGLGLMSLSLLTALGGKGAVVIEPNSERRKIAELAGAIATFSPTDKDISRLIFESTGQKVLQVLDLVGTEQTANLGFELLAKGGHLVTLGLFGGAANWPLPLLAIKAITIQGSYVGSLPELQELVKLVTKHQLKLIPTKVQKLSSVQEALEELDKGTVIGRRIITP